MSQQKVLVLVGDAAEELDAMYPIYRLREAGYIADVAALTRREVQLVIHDFDPNSDAYTEKNGRKLPVDIAFAEVDPSEYVGLVIPGGRAPEYIRLDADVRRITEYFFEHDLPVGTICHGPQVPAVYGLLRGRKTAAFPPLKGDMENAGATVVDAPDVRRRQHGLVPRLAGHAGVVARVHERARARRRPGLSAVRCSPKAPGRPCCCCTAPARGRRRRRGRR